MATMVNRKIMDIKWPPNDHVWFDIWIWERMKGLTVHFDKPINIGIKHGHGLTGGNGHNSGASLYRQGDFNMKYLESLVDGHSFNFYKSLTI